jgi:hypothetical protein
MTGEIGHHRKAAMDYLDEQARLAERPEVPTTVPQVLLVLSPQTARVVMAACIQASESRPDDADAIVQLEAVITEIDEQL